MLNVVSRLETLKINYDKLDIARISCGIEEKESLFINKISQTFKFEVSKLIALFSFNKDTIKDETKYKIVEINRKDLYDDIDRIRNKELNVYAKLLLPHKATVEEIVLTSNLSLVNNTKIVVPMGMSIRMLDAIDEVSKGIELCNQHLLPVLSELNLYISTLLSDPKSRSTVSKIDSRKGKDDVDVINKKLNEILNNVINVNSTEQHKKFKQLYPIILEFGKSYNNYLNLTNIVNVDYLSKVLTLTDQISYKIEELINQLQSDNENVKVSSNTIKTLLSDTGKAADFVTYATSVFLLSDYLGQTILDTINKTKNIK